MVAQPKNLQRDSFENSINELERYFIIQTFQFNPLFNFLPTLPRPTRSIVGGKQRIFDITRANNTAENQKLVQRVTNINQNLHNEQIKRTVNKTNTTVSSIEKKEDTLRKKIDEAFQAIGNTLKAIQDIIDEWNNIILLSDAFNKLIEIYEIIKRFDGTYDICFFPTFYKISDTLNKLNDDFTKFKKDGISELKSINTYLDDLRKLNEDGFLIVDEVLKKLTDFVTNFTTQIKPKIININKKINSLTDAAKTLKDELDKLLKKIKIVKKNTNTLKSRTLRLLGGQDTIIADLAALNNRRFDCYY